VKGFASGHGNRTHATFYRSKAVRCATLVRGIACWCGNLTHDATHCDLVVVE
jgi:hypothetical protein